MMFLDIDDTMERRLAFALGIEESELPIIVSFKFDQNSRSLIKYKCEKKEFYNYYNLLQETKAVFKYNQESFQRSSYTNVNNAYSNVIEFNHFSMKNFINFKIPDRLNLKQIYLFEFAASFCIHSKKLTIIIDKLSKIYKNSKSNVVFARVHLYQNDHPGIDITEVPTIRLYNIKKEYEQYDIDDFTEDKIISVLDAFIEKQYGQKEDL